MSFTTLGLGQPLLDAVSHEGYTQPTPIQNKAIPAILAGHDLLAAAQTGTGKTAAFALPILERLAARTQRQPRALIITPTRELATQVADSTRSYGQRLGLRTTVVFGGVGYAPQIKTFRRGVDIVVATPGRLLDHLQQGNIDLSAIETLVLDEADRMLDMGFIHSIRKIQQYLPSRCQRLLFSATFSNKIRSLAKGLLNEPEEIDVAPRNTAAKEVTQKVIFAPKARKRAITSHLVRNNSWDQVLVFTRTKHGANRLCHQLESDGLPAAALHGNKSQSARNRALSGFKSGKIRVLVATDIAARGIDIAQLPQVINFDLPTVAEDYVHRIGRTGRAGHTGEALSLTAPDEQKQLKAIERLIGHKIARLELDLPGIDSGESSDNDENAPRHPPRRQGKSRPQTPHSQINTAEKRSRPRRKPKRRKHNLRVRGWQRLIRARGASQR